jgi:hypothetical protein
MHHKRHAGIPAPLAAAICNPGAALWNGAHFRSPVAAERRNRVGKPSGSYVVGGLAALYPRNILELIGA